MVMREEYPATWQEFIEDKYFRDHKEIYTNGSEIMLVSDVKKMVQHYLQERPKGRWVLGSELDDVEYEHFLYCSNCHEEAYWDTDYGQQTFDFCPNCGSDNRESEG